MVVVPNPPKQVRLRVLLPVAENCVSGGSFRPGDVLTGRNGLTTEVGNTDAEGRLLLGDALVEADSIDGDDSDGDDTKGNDHLIIDFATLTGAARVATGTDIGAVNKICSNNYPVNQKLSTRPLMALFFVVCFYLGTYEYAHTCPCPCLCAMQVFSNDPKIARALQDTSELPHVRDPLWAQPLAQCYRSELASPIADLRNIGAGK